MLAKECYGSHLLGYKGLCYYSVCLQIMTDETIE